ncbi:MAG: alpha/beta fold hydrolase [Desulfosudaceae bacterium]
MKIELGQTTTHYELTGSGESLVLIHGFSDNLDLWQRQVPVFAEKYRVLTYDVRGHGRTESTDDRFSMDRLADDLYALVAALDLDRCHLLGFSMGGRIAAGFTLRHPDRVASLILANSGIPGPGLQLSEEKKAEMAKRRQLMAQLVESGDNPAIAEIMTQLSFSPGIKERQPDLFEQYKNLKLQNDPVHYGALVQALMEGMENPPDLTQITCPTLVIAGEQDSFMSREMARSMEQALPRVETVIFPTGHAAALEMPDRFNRVVLDFLASLPTKG